MLTGRRDQLMTKGTFRTANGFKEWAFDHDLRVATNDPRLDLSGLFVEHDRALFCVWYDPIDGRIRDAEVHVENGPTHQIGSNTLSQLARAFLRTRPKEGS
jgi:hypothetical protein